MKSYLITGGCGFIGTNLVTRLAARGAKIRVLDNLCVGKRQDIERSGAELVVGDIRDPGILAQVTKGVDIVVHLAAHTGVIESVKDPVHDFEVNAFGTLNALRASLAAGVRKFIFASTGGAILGEQEPPVDEQMVPRPVSPYGASKLVGEAYCSAFFGSFGLNTVALRFSNVYGPFSYHKGSVIAQFLKNLKHEEPLLIYGDGSQTRDFLYVEDLVSAILLAEERDTPGEVFHVASGRETTIGHLVEVLRGLLCDRRIRVTYAPRRPGEVSRNFARIDKARRLLGYEPRVQLAEGLAWTWEWFLYQSGKSLAVH